MVQPQPNRVLGPDSSPSLTSSVRAALEDWKSTRTLLANAIQPYLSACAVLNSVCTLPAHHPEERAVVEEVLVAVDSELSSLTSEADALRDVQISLSSLRNKSGTLTRINVLPSEVLSYIFKLSTTYCVRDKTTNSCFNALAGVDTYWRQVALSTPELWTHIDITPDIPTQSLYDASKLRFERSKGEPIYLHVYEPCKSFYGRTPTPVVKGLQDFLAPYAPRVSILHLETEIQSAILVQSILGLWKDGGFSGLKDLYVHVPKSDNRYQLNIHDPVGKKARKNAVSIKTLHLQNARFGWGSVAYHGLVDLRLEGSDSSPIPIKVPEFANVLAMSPGLVTLKLSDIVITRWNWGSNDMDQSVPSPTTLNHLKVLNLVKISPVPLEYILPSIVQPNAAAQLSVGLTFYEDGPHDEYQHFFSRCHVTTLYHESDGEQLSLGDIPASVRRLVVFQSDISQQPSLAKERRQDPGAPSTLHIPHVTLVSCIVTLEGLVSLVAEIGIQVLSLDCCVTGHLTDLDGVVRDVSQDVATSLMEVYPNVIWRVVEKNEESAS
ncbi:hypothetical protein FRC10_001425 [Ceratobasidium sp. 414]|nr:hypothetical protein FRC10_001425 [Ceratobasidium sp. 414]